MRVWTRVKSAITIAGSVAGVATLLIALMAIFPSRYAVLQGGVFCAPDVFSLERLSTSSGTQIVGECVGHDDTEWKQGLFSGTSILSGSGEFSDESTSHIWVVLLDCYGRGYLQYPPARLAGSRWTMANVRLGRQIATIEFWGVDETGHRELQRLAEGMSRDRSWPPQILEDLPDHFVLGSVDLVYRGGFLSSIF